MKRIVLLEDLIDSQEDAVGLLASEGYSVETVTYESEFRTSLDRWETATPSLFIIDFMVPWAEPTDSIPEPPEDVLADNGFHRAGIRCQTALAKRPKLATIPVIFWTVITLEDLLAELNGPLPPGSYYVAKDDGLDALLVTVRDVLSTPATR